MTKAKVDVDMGDGVHITVSAEAETQALALEMAYNRATAVVRYMSAVEAEVASADADVSELVRGRRGQ